MSKRKNRGRTMARPQRWARPFGPEMTDEDAEKLLARPEFAAVDADAFPPHTPLFGILRNDSRIMRYGTGEIVFQEGDYGHSAFLVLSGKFRAVTAPGLPGTLLGRQPVRRKGFFKALAQLWGNRRVPEVRDIHRYEALNSRSDRRLHAGRAFVQDIPAAVDEHRSAELGEGSLFGEMAALGRIPRTSTVFAETDAELLEIRWQGLREIRRYDELWRRHIDQLYRRRALRSHLLRTPFFEDLGPEEMQQVVAHTEFASYGTFDWHASYKALGRHGGGRDEPVIVEEGDYPNGVLLIRAGFARVTIKMGNAERTLTYLGAGDYYGFDELFEAWRDGGHTPFRTTVRALGYVDVLRVPASIMERYVFPRITTPPDPLIELAQQPLVSGSIIDWAIDERFVNGTKAMLIDLDRCIRCDDCVRACAAAHDGNPRFVRHGEIFKNWMVANACMQCVDPVCMIGCPTGAIQRTVKTGTVFIDDDICIGCATCAESCPYNNIRMVEISSNKGEPIVDDESGLPIVKATKCDLCEDQLGGPACVRACSQDALQRVDFHALDSFREAGR